MREFGNKRLVKDESTGESSLKPSPVRAITRNGLSGSFGPDRDRRLVCSLDDGDLITLRPQGTQRPKSISVFDVYTMIHRVEAQRINLEKARAKKEKLATRRAAARQATAERRLLRDV